MSDIKDGGPAFPGKQSTIVIPSECTHAKQINVDMNGMSLRDWFAGMAIRIETHPGNFSRDPYLIAQKAYALADAMLKERDKK